MILVIFEIGKNHGRRSGAPCGPNFFKMKARQKELFGGGSVVLVIFENDKDHSPSGCPRVVGELSI